MMMIAGSLYQMCGTYLMVGLVPTTTGGKGAGESFEYTLTFLISKYAVSNFDPGPTTLS